MTDKPTFITAEHIRRDLRARRERRLDPVVVAEIIDLAEYLERWPNAPHPDVRAGSS